MTKETALPGTGKTVGIIGCGSIGSRYTRCLYELGASPALFDSDAERVRALGAAVSAEGLGEPIIAASRDALLAMPLYGVIVATPPRFHAEAACAVVAAGHRLLCEKPLADSAENGAAIKAAADAATAYAGGVCNMRYHPAVQVLREQLPRIGTPVLARARFGHRLAQMRPAGLDVFASSYRDGGGVVLDCVHELDYLTWLFGRLRPVWHVAQQIGAERISAEDWASAVLVSESGVRVELSLDLLARYKRRGCEIIGTEGSLVWLSLGRRPEVATVTFETTDDQEVIWQSSSIDPNGEYLDMLRAFLVDPDSLQSIDAAYHALELAITLREITD